jgi:hypothetical protein
MDLDPRLAEIVAPVTAATAITAERALALAQGAYPDASEVEVAAILRHGWLTAEAHDVASVPDTLPAVLIEQATAVAA